MVGDYAYIADGSAGLQIIDISNPAKDTPTGSYDTTHYAKNVSVVGNYAYIADGSAGLQIIDISNPDRPTLAGSYDTPGDTWDVSVVGDYAYIADGSAGLQIIDIGNFVPASVANINDVPTEITLDSDSVDENEAVGTVLGTFSTTDEDTADTHTYSLVSGEGDTDNPQFKIVNGQLQTTASFNYNSKDFYNIRVQTDDGNGGTFQQQFTIYINDVHGLGQVIEGTASADILIGNDRDNLLNGGRGADTLTGGSGVDQFVLSPGDGSDTITDFQDGQDLLKLDNDLSFNDLTIETFTVVKLGDEVLATLNGVESSLITAEDFI